MELNLKKWYRDWALMSRFFNAGEIAGIAQKLENMEIEASQNSDGSFRCFVSDIPNKFDEVGTRFLGEPVINAERVDFDNFLIEKGEKIYTPLNLIE